MVTTLAPLLLDGTAAATASQVSYRAGSIWEVGANIKTQGIPFAAFVLMGVGGIIAAYQFMVNANKTAALKIVAIAAVLIGLITALPSLGGMSRDTVTSITNSGGFR